MPTYDDFPFRAAATVAVALMEESTALEQAKAIDVAWHAYKDLEAAGPEAKFLAERYSGEVEAAIRGIRSGRLEKVQPSPRVLQNAHKLLGSS